MKRNRLPTGTIFWEKYSGYYFFYKIILDFEKVNNLGHNDLSNASNSQLTNSSLYFDTSSKDYLVQVFEGRYTDCILPKNSPLLINGVLLSNRFQKKRTYKGEGWGVYDYSIIDKNTIDCCEYVINGDRLYGEPHTFIKGNVRIDFDAPLKERHIIEVLFQLTKLSELAQYLMGFSKVMDPVILDDYNCDLRQKDETRKLIYEAIGESPNITWNELSLKYGLDLGVLLGE